MLDQKPKLSSYMTHMLANGRVVFLREEAQEVLGVSRGAFLDSAERQQDRKHLIRPRHGFYVIVPPQYLAWGAPPPSWYIDSLMCYEGCQYYVGLLKAAELYGVARHAIMEFQIIADKRLPKIRAGRSSIVFSYRKDMGKVARGIDKLKTDTGFMNISSIELMILDMVRYTNATGGLDNIMTVLDGLLGEGINLPRFMDLLHAFERSVLQRLGYLLEISGYADVSDSLHTYLFGSFFPTWVELEPSRYADRSFVPEPIERNRRWKVVVRHVPEADK